MQIVAEFQILYHSGELINPESACMAINEEETTVYHMESTVFLK